MAILKFDNTVAGWAQINALPDPKHSIISGARVVVLTGADVPPEEAVIDPASIILTTRQFIQGADAIGRARLQAIESYIRNIVGVDAKDPADQILPAGNYAQIKFWKWHNATIRRTDPHINALRVAIQGARTNAQSIAEMDQIFVAGSGMDP